MAAHGALVHPELGRRDCVAVAFRDRFHCLTQNLVRQSYCRHARTPYLTPEGGLANGVT